eukprot:TRINITY_DN17960_c0_g1_i2.p1 TRINITY_DN17960_c0_g1~~TRINITY_DN17960_c0_g1_i2.p1  ORF type:complete len:225 (-),score=30.14 TRINITY_DN17960_c0_g1_i2:123-740(-)
MCIRDRIWEVVSSEQSLTHPDPTVHLVCTCYAIAITHFLNNPRDAKGALEKVEIFIRNKQNALITSWLEESRKYDLEACPDNQIGWVKYAWSYTFAILHVLASDSASSKIGSQDDIFRHYQRIVISLGGDTDTNACIVGGMLGAYLGIQGLPRDLVEKAKRFDPEHNTNKIRPQQYAPGRCEEIVEFLLNYAPSEMTFRKLSAPR